MATYFKSGSWDVICDRCGVKYKSEELRKEWTGFMVCGPCFENRHPSDLIRVPKEKISVPWSRPEPEDSFVSIPEFLLTEDLSPLDPENEILPLQTES